MPEVEKDPPDDGRNNNNEDYEETEPLSQFNSQLNHLQLRSDPARRLHSQESGDASLETGSPTLSTQSWTASFQGLSSTDYVVTSVTIFAPKFDERFSLGKGASFLPTHSGTTGARCRSTRSLSLDSINDLEGFGFLKHVQADVEVDHAASDFWSANRTDRMAPRDARNDNSFSVGMVSQQYRARGADTSGTEKHLGEMGSMQTSGSLFHGHFIPDLLLPAAAASSANAGADETAFSLRSTGGGSVQQSNPASDLKAGARGSSMQQSNPARLMNSGQPPPSFAVQNSAGQEPSPSEEDVFDESNPEFLWPRPSPNRFSSSCQYFRRSVSCSF